MSGSSSQLSPEWQRRECVGVADVDELGALVSERQRIDGGPFDAMITISVASGGTLDLNANSNSVNGTMSGSAESVNVSGATSAVSATGPGVNFSG